MAKPYLPYYDKWSNYYNKVVTGEYNSYLDQIGRGNNQRGGSVSKRADSFMIPIEKTSTNKKSFRWTECEFGVASAANQRNGSKQYKAGSQMLCPSNEA